MIVETDAASIQASQYLVDVIDRAKLREKLDGFILNKVMDNPSMLAGAGRGFFRCDYWGAIPFDLATQRRFILGNLPEMDSLFLTHVAKALTNFVDDVPNILTRRTLKEDDFNSLMLKDPRLRISSTLITIIVMLSALSYVMLHIDRIGEIEIIPANMDKAAAKFSVFAILIILYALSLSDQAKFAIGNAFVWCVSKVTSVFCKRI